MKGLHRVHEHPSYEWRSRSLVEPIDALASKRLQKTFYRSAELDFGACLQPDLDGIKPRWFVSRGLDRGGAWYGCPTVLILSTS